MLALQIHTLTTHQEPSTQHQTRSFRVPMILLQQSLYGTCENLLMFGGEVHEAYAEATRGWIGHDLATHGDQLLAWQFQLHANRTGWQLARPFDEAAARAEVADSAGEVSRHAAPAALERSGSTLVGSALLNHGLRRGRGQSFRRFDATIDSRHIW